MGKLGKSLMTVVLGAGAALLLAGTVVLLAGAMGLLIPGTAHAAQPMPTAGGTPPVVPWLMTAHADPAGSGRLLIYMRIVRNPAKSLVRDNPTMRTQQQTPPPDLTEGHTGRGALASPGAAAHS